ncbi:hypothetical protein TNCV_2583991 [Trichonephila clavipes]|nr:hypothetical protein TNCV_2583991 [Trichonephila clavipes]
MARVTEDHYTTRGLGSDECGQHLCPPENRRASRKGHVQHEFYVDVSGDSRVQWSDETQQLLYVFATWEDPGDYSTRSHWNFSQHISS